MFSEVRVLPDIPLRLAAIALALATTVLAGCGSASHSSSRPAPARATSPGRILEGSFRSQAISDQEHYAVYLPANYDSSGKRYPVIYALHGLPAGPRSYRGMSVRDWGADAEHAGRPAIVVSPQGARRGDTDPEWHDWHRGRNWESAVARELVAQVDRRYRTVADRRGRAIIGVSAGGYGASIIGIRHPETFSVIQSWSGYFHPTNPVGDAPLSLGSPEADSAASVHSYVRAAKRIADSKAPFAFSFYVGDADPHFLEENEQLHAELLRARVPHTYAVYPGAHSGSVWAEHEEEWISAAVRALAPAR